MLKAVLLGVWGVVVTALSTLGASYLDLGSAEAPQAEVEDLGTEEMKTEMMSVPMVRGGEVVGYLILQLAFQADKRLLEEKKLEPQAYLTDAALRVALSRTELDFRRLRGRDIDDLTTAIAKEANARIGGELVRAVLVQQLNFVKKEDIRTNWIGKGTTDH